MRLLCKIYLLLGGYFFASVWINIVRLHTALIIKCIGITWLHLSKYRYFMQIKVGSIIKIWIRCQSIDFIFKKMYGEKYSHGLSSLKLIWIDRKRTKIFEDFFFKIASISPQKAHVNVEHSFWTLWIILTGI